MSDLAFNLLGNVAYKYGRNPDVVGVKDGQPVNANGEVVPLMKEPNLLGRLFSPDAERAMQLNSQVANAGIMSQIERDNQRRTTGQDIDTLPYQNNPNLGAFGAPQGNKLSPQVGEEGGLYAGLISQTAPEDYHTFTSGAPTKANVGNMDLAGKERQAWITQTINPRLEATQLKPNIEAQAGIPYAASTGQLLGHASNVAAGTSYRQSIFDAAKQDRENALYMKNLSNSDKLATDITPNELSEREALAKYAALHIDQTLSDRDKAAELARITNEVNLARMNGDMHSIDYILQADKLANMNRAYSNGIVQSPTGLYHTIGAGGTLSPEQLASDPAAMRDAELMAKLSGKQVGGISVKAPSGVSWTTHATPSAPIPILQGQVAPPISPIGVKADDHVPLPAHIQDVKDAVDAEHKSEQSKIKVQQAMLKQRADELKAKHMKKTIGLQSTGGGYGHLGEAPPNLLGQAESLFNTGRNAYNAANYYIQP